MESPPGPPPGQTAALRGLLAAAAALTVGHALGYAALLGRFCIDDAYISFRYAENLARGLGLVFNAGERVEGYTNFGWVMLLALASRLGLDLPAASRLGNLLLAVALVALALRFLARRSRRPVLAVALAGGALAADGVLARWAQDGMETVLFTLLVFLGAALSASGERQSGGAGEPAAPPPWRGALVFALAALVRPEGALLAAAALLWGVLAASRGGWRRALRRAVLGGLVFTAVWLPYFLWRWRYYGALLPNTFYAKVGTGGAQVLRGAHYLVYFFVAQRWPWLLLALGGLLALPRPRLVPWQRLFLWIAAVHLLYVLLVGGDWMGAGRFVLPVMPLLYLAAAEWTALAIEGGRRWTSRLALPALAGLIVAQLVLTSWRGELRSVRGDLPYLRSREAVGTWLRRHAAPGDTLLTGEIGQLGWDSGLYTLDLFGLTDPRIAHLSVATMGRGKPGHEKFDLAYSLSQRPTWIVMPFMVPLYQSRPAAFPVLAEYEPVRLPTPPPIPSYGAFLHRWSR